MGDFSIELMGPIPVAVLALFLGACILYLLYTAAKFIISLWTGA